MKTLLTAIALTIALPAVAYAAEPAKAGNQECCEKRADGKPNACCEKKADGRQAACCAKPAGTKGADPHAGHDMSKAADPHAHNMNH